MNKRSRLKSKTLVFMFVLCVLIPLSASALERGFVENFSTKQYCDTPNTTALWDTVAGELRLPPFELALAGTYDTPSRAWNVTVEGDYAYVADWASGLQVINISDPTTPTFAGNYNTPGWAEGVVVEGNYAYVADYQTLQVINISDPTTPTFAGSYSTPSYARGLAVEGDYAYVADYESGLQVINISNPSAPYSAGSYDTPDRAYGIAVAGNYAYVADNDSGLVVIDISDPTTPTFAGSYSTPGDARHVAVAGDYLYVGGSSSLQVIDISDPTAPAYAGSYNCPDATRGVTVEGDHLYVADSSQGLQVIDISNPSIPTLAHSYDTPDYAYDVAVAGGYAYVADYLSGLQVIDVADPVSPALAGIGDTPQSAQRVAIAGNYAYVPDFEGGLAVIDISDPGNPILAGNYSTSYFALDVAIAGDYAYLGTYDSLKVIDISDPTNPTRAASYNTPGNAYGVVIKGDYAYVADFGGGLQVIDISDPTTPVYAGSYGTPWSAFAVAVEGNYAYVADGDSLQVIDISDPTTPTYAGSQNMHDAKDVAVEGNYAYVADGNSGLVVIDISDPTTPTHAGSYDTPGQAWGVAIEGDYAYVADWNSLRVVDISDPTTPVYAGSYDTPSAVIGVTVEGNYAFSAVTVAGVYAVQVYQRTVSATGARGQSLVVNSERENVDRVKLSTSAIGSIVWEVSADSGTSWTSILPDGEWNKVAVPGSSLVWRDSLVFQAGANPTCTSLEIGWLYDFAVIDSIVDVGGDQGGWARVYFTRSGKDFADETSYPIDDYFVFRRVDDVELVKEILDKNERVEGGVMFSEHYPAEAGDDTNISENVKTVPSSLCGSKVLSLGDRYFVVSEHSVSGSLPPGTWEVVGSVPGHQEDQYICLVPTLADSTSTLVHSVYCISAETTTPSVYYFSPPDSGYSVDNLSPAPPEGLAGDYSYPPSELLIRWDANTDYDLSHYAMYKGASEDFIPDEGNRIGAPTDTFLVDSAFDPNVENYYKLSAWDVHENESGYSVLRPEEITGVAGSPAPPAITLLEQNVPNPFNPLTVIRFSIAEPGWVKLVVYDVAGRPVRTLAGGHRAVDRYEAIWDGCDDLGRTVASGVYIYQLEAPGYMKSKKMVLLK